MLRVPRALRAQPGFYRGIARATAPALFALPTKNDLGLAPGASPLRHTLRHARFKLGRRLRRSFPGQAFGREPGLNYADFDHELRTPTPLRDVVEDSLRRLRDLAVLDWLDPVALWVRHQRRRANLGVALVLLSALELNLAAEASPLPERGPGAPAAPPRG